MEPAELLSDPEAMKTVSTSRPCRDLHWAVLFLLGVACTMGVGYEQMTVVRLAAKELQQCDTIQDLAEMQRKVAEKAGEVIISSHSDFNYDTELLFAAGLGVFVVAFLIGSLFLCALEKQAMCISWVALSSAPIMGLFAGGIFLGLGDDKVPGSTTIRSVGYQIDPIYAYILIACSMILILVICCKRAQINLCAELLRLSATAMAENREMLYTIGLTSLGFAFLLILPLGGLGVFALYPQQAAGALAGCVGCFPLPGGKFNTTYSLSMAVKMCPEQADTLKAVNSWSAKPDIVVPITFMILWAHFLSQEVRVANVGGTIGLHYFQQRVNGSRSVQACKWALSKNFGSLCFAAFVLSVVSAIGYLVNKLRAKADEEGNKITRFIMACVQCCWVCIQKYIEFLTKMTVIAMSITGEAFCTSGKNTQALLRRNDLDGIVLDTFTRFILTLFTLAVGLGLGLSAWVFAPHNMAKALGMITFTLTVAVCGAQSGMILSISNAHYMCYILDLESKTAPTSVTQMIHDLYGQAVDRCRCSRCTHEHTSGYGGRPASMTGGVG